MVEAVRVQRLALGARERECLGAVVHVELRATAAILVPLVGVDAERRGSVAQRKLQCTGRAKRIPCGSKDRLLPDQERLEPELPTKLTQLAVGVLRERLHEGTS